MALTTLTRREKQWRERAARAVEAEEQWEKCDDCLRYHPEGYEGECDDLENRLPRRPQDLID